MGLIEEAHSRAFPGSSFPYTATIEYNRRLHPFNANLRLRGHLLHLSLNLEWKDIDPEIKIGLVQHLLVKLLGQRMTTPNIELYHHFIKNIPILTPKTKTDSVLEASFSRINERFFSNALEKPNLQWGQHAHRKLASYNFHNDTITVSSLFQDAREDVLDFLMYHELLHKHHQFTQKEGRSSFHNKAFRMAEKEYPGHEEVEKEIERLIRSRRPYFKASAPKRSVRSSLRRLFSW